MFDKKLEKFSASMPAVVLEVAGGFIKLAQEQEHTVGFYNQSSHMYRTYIENGRLICLDPSNLLELRHPDIKADKPAACYFPDECLDKCVRQYMQLRDENGESFHAEIFPSPRFVYLNEGFCSIFGHESKESKQYDTSFATYFNFDSGNSIDGNSYRACETSGLFEQIKRRLPEWNEWSALQVAAALPLYHLGLVSEGLKWQSEFTQDMPTLSLIGDDKFQTWHLQSGPNFDAFFATGKQAETNLEETPAT